jgi:hypothetical protein
MSRPYPVSLNLGNRDILSPISPTGGHDRTPTSFEKYWDEQRTNEPGIERCERTQRLALLGLLGFAILSFAAFGIGLHLVLAEDTSVPSFLRGKTAIVGIMPYVWFGPEGEYSNPGHWAYSMSPAAVVIMPLILNLLLTVAFSITSFIDATILRWALWKDGNLIFHSNPRLLVTSKTHPPTSWYARVFSVMALVFAYGSTALLTTEIEVLGITDETLLPVNVKPFDGPHHGIDFNGWALLTLGVSMFVQILITLWGILWDPELVRTWSSNPFMTARACSIDRFRPDFLKGKAEKNAQPRNFYSTIRYVFTKRETPAPNPSRNDSFGLQDTLSRHPTHKVIRPKHHQQSVRCSLKSISRLTTNLWLLSLLFSAVVLVVALVASRSGRTTSSWVSSAGSGTKLSAYWHMYGVVDFPYFTTVNGYRINRPGLGILIQSVFQAPLTLGLHSTSLLLNVIRDEYTWRKISAPNGANFTANNLFDAALNWPGWLFFLYKGAAQWLFGYALNVNEVVVVSLLPLVSLTVFLLILAVLLETLSRRSPKGPLPTTWGNMELLIDMIKDVRGDKIFWGHAGTRNGVCIVGTAAESLPEVRHSQLYYGNLSGGT